jgi:hypothetical protein
MTMPPLPSYMAVTSLIPVIAACCLSRRAEETCHHERDVILGQPVHVGEEGGAGAHVAQHETHVVHQVLRSQHLRWESLVAGLRNLRKIDLNLTLAPPPPPPYIIPFFSVYIIS